MVVVPTIPAKRPLFSGHLILPALISPPHRTSFSPESQNDLKRPIRSPVNHWLKTHHKTQIHDQGLPKLHSPPCPDLPTMSPATVLSHCAAATGSRFLSSPQTHQADPHLRARNTLRSLPPPHLSQLLASLSTELSTSSAGFMHSFLFVLPFYQVCPTGLESGLTSTVSQHGAVPSLAGV